MAALVSIPIVVSRLETTEEDSKTLPTLSLYLVAAKVGVGRVFGLRPEGIVCVDV